jgi:hypothetical protein
MHLIDLLTSHAIKPIHSAPVLPVRGQKKEPIRFPASPLFPSPSPSRRPPSGLQLWPSPPRKSAPNEAAQHPFTNQRPTITFSSSQPITPQRILPGRGHSHSSQKRPFLDRPVETQHMQWHVLAGGTGQRTAAREPEQPQPHTTNPTSAPLRAGHYFHPLDIGR